jgi:HSP20 family protein
MRAEDYVRDGQYVLRAELPGCDPERDIEVTASRGILTIHAERREKTGTRHHSEFRYRTFARSFRLPPNAAESRIRSIYGNGILEVTPRPHHRGRPGRAAARAGDGQPPHQAHLKGRTRPGPVSAR